MKDKNQSSLALSLSSTKLPSTLSSPAILACRLAVLPTRCIFILFRKGVPSSSSSMSSLSLFSGLKSPFGGLFALAGDAFPLADFPALSSFLRLCFSPLLSTFFRTPPGFESSSSSSSISPFFDGREPGVGVPPLLPNGDPATPLAFILAVREAPRPPMPRHFSRCCANRVMSRLRLHDGQVCQGT